MLPGARAAKDQREGSRCSLVSGGAPSAVKVLGGDAHALPLATAIDRARADRVLMHCRRPAPALAEMHRILRPGGLLTLAEPDWDTLAIDHPDLATSRAFPRFIAERANRN